MLLTNYVVKPHVDLFVDSNEQNLWIVVLDFNFLSYHFNCCLKWLDFGSYVFLDLGFGEALSVNYDEIWDSFGGFIIAFSPVLKDWIKRSLWNLLLPLYPHNGLGVHLWTGFIDSPHKCQCVSLGTFTNRISSVHYFLVPKSLVWLWNLPQGKT